MILGNFATRCRKVSMYGVKLLCLVCKECDSNEK
jgi:hypothetical protein